jgi:N-acetylmuramoyl-L-alanine amidase
MKVAICIGHSRPGDKGAQSVSGVSEWSYNVAVGEALQKMLTISGVEAVMITSYLGDSYGFAMTWLASEIDRLNVDCAIELHFNAAGPSAKGYEYLYWSSSSASKRLAQALLDAHERNLGGINRGIKPKTSSDRGSLFLSKPQCPCVITEPFFGSNASDWSKFSTEKAQRDLAKTYADGILSFLGVDAKPATNKEPEPNIDKAAIIARVEAIEWQLSQLRKEIG